jgi:hypothetical protein
MIYDPIPDFPFGNVKLNTPSSNGSSYFIRFSIDGESPLYLQPPKCIVKQIAVSSKNAKRMNCDLQFQKENENFINWMDLLEKHVQEKIFENKSKWFDTELSLEDIKSSFIPTLKPYKGSKFYLIRTALPNQNGVCSIKIYDEDENDTSIDNIKEGCQIMTIMEIMGVKCSSRNFQIEVELKQIMIAKPVILFEKCLFHKPAIKVALKDDKYPQLTAETLENHMDDLGNKSVVAEIAEPESYTVKPAISTEGVKEVERDVIYDKYPEEETRKLMEVEEQEKGEEEKGGKMEIAEFEIDLDKMNEGDTIQIKKRDDVYYEMYREARRKAKVARDLAISAYLEAKQIKNMYMLDDLKDSDESDIDLEEDDEYDDDDSLEKMSEQEE